MDSLPGPTLPWRRTSRALPWILCILLLLGLVACGGDGEGEGPGCWHGASNPLPPTGLHYSRDAVVYQRDQPIEPNAPMNGGGPIVRYAVAPALPEGLSMDPMSGVVSGTPLMLAAPAIYEVTGTAVCGSTKTGLQIAVASALLPPEALRYENQDGVYTVGQPIAPNHPLVEGGSVAHYAVQPALPEGLHLDPATGVIAGTATHPVAPADFIVTASNGAGAASTALRIEVRTAPVAPASLAYRAPSVVYAVGRAVLPNHPQGTGGAVTSYAVAPPLPAGLSIDATSGAISGAPLAAVVAADYTVAGSNSAGAASAIVRIAVLPAGSAAPTGEMLAPRSNASASLLVDGQVLVAGGYDDSGALATAELYDPGTGAWTGASPMGSARFFHTATALTDGQILVAGGENSSGSLATAERYDPGTRQWTTAGPMNAARSGHTATRLPDGRVLVAGGYDGSYLDSAEIYDPATATWIPAGSMGAARSLHTATPLPDGRVLVAGGFGAGALASAEVFDPATATWSPTGAMSTARLTHTALPLPDGRVLVAAGYGGGALASAELYDPASGAWTPTGALNGARVGHTARLLPAGTVLVQGGYDNGATLSSAELYHPDTGQWVLTGTLVQPRYFHTATLLPDGNVLVAGGHDAASLGTAELHVP